MTPRSLFYASAFLVLLTYDSFGQASNTLKGKIRTPTGETVNNAIVELRQNSGGIIGQTVTRNDGDFAFSNLAPGDYEVLVSMSGYIPATQMVRFQAHERGVFNEIYNIEVTITPKKEQSLGPPGINFVQDVPKPARTAYDKALVKIGESKIDEAIPLLREAVEAFNNYFNASFQLGLALFQTGKLDEAIQMLERARQINDREPAVYHSFGLVMIKQQKFGVAEYAFREAIRLNGNDASSHFYRGLVLIEVAKQLTDRTKREKELADAEGEMNKVWDLSGHRMFAVYRQKARIRELRGDLEGAAQELEAYLKADPNAKDAAVVREMVSKLRAPK
jgi:tetratricopeptide (TPR) repeat protein